MYLLEKDLCSAILCTCSNFGIQADNHLGVDQYFAMELSCKFV